jgi:hypothetical protein
MRQSPTNARASAARGSGRWRPCPSCSTRPPASSRLDTGLHLDVQTISLMDLPCQKEFRFYRRRRANRRRRALALEARAEAWLTSFLDAQVAHEIVPRCLLELLTDKQQQVGRSPHSTSTSMPFTDASWCCRRPSRLSAGRSGRRRSRYSSETN